MQKLTMQTEVHVDNLVQSIADIIVRVFGSRILSVYLGGSLNRNQPTVTSDIDMTIVFRGFVSDEEYEHFIALRESLQVLSPLRLDLWPISEKKIKSRPASASVRASSCLYGESFLHLVPAQSIDAFAMRSIHKAVHYMAVLRGQPKSNLAPLTYPDADTAYYGYTRYGDINGVNSFGPGTRIIISMLTQCTTALLAVERGIEVGTKQDSVEKYISHIGDRWKDFVRDVYETIKIQLQYQMPPDEESQKRVNFLLRQLPAFENDALMRFKSTICDSLRDGDSRRRKLAFVVLKNVQIHDEDILRAVQSVPGLEDDDLVRSVKSILKVNEHRL